MKFNVCKIVLWLKNGKRRELEFLPNKVNVITGDSNTGKTAILEIIDYCFFASHSKISESVINENVLWYGLLININDKKYTIARKSLNEGKVSHEYYFSSMGEVPDIIEMNSQEKAIKSILEAEFSIDSNVSIPYGSNIIKAGSKISLRFFLLFNTISGNIIENDEGIFFDKQNESRYRDALPRIFDLAIGIETIKNVLKKEKKSELEKELNRLKRREHVLSAKAGDFRHEQELVIKTAKEYDLINADLDLNSSIDELKKAVSGVETETSGDGEERSELEKEYYIKERKIKNLKSFVTEYGVYKRNLKNIEDSLKPIEYLKEKDSELIKTSIFDDIISSFSLEIKKVRESYENRTPVDGQVSDAIKKLESELEVLKERLSIQPEINRSFEDNRSKYFFLGETKSKMELFSTSENSFIETTNTDIEDLEEKIGLIDVDDVTEKKNLTIKLIEEIISEYIDDAGTALENYASYKPVFDYTNKSLLLRKPKTSFIESVGSSSNHMFLHLFFTLAMQEVAFKNESPFVAPFLVIDQPSRPYYGDSENRKDNIDHSDESKITKAFELLDKYIETRSNNSSEFQMIVFEHVPSKIFSKLNNVHLVEEFRNGNALILLDED